MSTTKTFTITGMTCRQCVASVREEVEAVAGVKDVAVDLASGALTVTGEADDDAVRAAVDEAGYTVVA